MLRSKLGGNARGGMNGERAMATFGLDTDAHIVLGIFLKQKPTIMLWLRAGALNGKMKSFPPIPIPRHGGNVQGDIGGKHIITVFGVVTVAHIALAGFPRPGLTTMPSQKAGDMNGWAKNPRPLL